MHAGEARTHSGDRWLLLVRVGWLALALLVVVMLLTGLPLLYGQLRADTPGVAGLSPGAAAYVLALNGVFALACLAPAALLVWRGATSRMALYAAFTFTLLPAGVSDVANALAKSGAVWGTVVRIVAYLGPVAFAIFLYLFPDGRFIPRWTRWLVACWLGWGLVGASLSGSAIDPNASRFGRLLFGGLVASIIYALVYRYRRVSGPVERQQTKWVAVSVALMVVALLCSSLLWSAVPSLQGGPIDILGIGSVMPLAFSLILLSFTVAILRYRLWDVDVVIRRTLIYGALTAALVALYLGSVALLQRLLSPLLGRDNQLAVVASTLAIAALFQPLRHRIQAMIDRRFYRRKYDATRTLAAFGTRLRAETDLERLRTDLLATVEEAMQPAHTSLWLRPPERRAGRDETHSASAGT